jgi:phosphoserine phosphatase
MSPDGVPDKAGEGKSEGTGGAVLIVGNNGISNDSICGILTEELGIKEDDIQVAETTLAATEILRKVEGVRQQIRLLIVQERLVGAKFIEYLQEDVFTGDGMPPVVITNREITSRSTADSLPAGSLSRIQKLLQEKPDFLKEILGNLNVLVINQSEEIRDQIKAALEKEGILPGNIFTTDNQSNGLDRVLGGVERELHAGEAVTKRKEDIHMIVMSPEEGSTLVEFAHEDRKVYPYTVVLSEGGQKIEQIWTSAKYNTADVSSMAYSDFGPAAIDQVALEADTLYRSQKHSEAQARMPHPTATTHSELPTISEEAPMPVVAASAADSERLIITPGDSESYFNFHRYARSLPTLVRHGDFEKNMALNPSQIEGNKVCSFDMDGTLLTAYVMGRFAQFLSKNENFDEIISGLPAKDKSNKYKLLRELMNIIEFITKTDEEKAASRNARARRFKDRPYEEILNILNNAYAELLEGLPVDIVCKKGHQFSLSDFDQHAIHYARPIINMIHSLGMMGTLLTGMPAEVIGGYREKLGIKERCYPLELRTKMVKDKLVFDKQVVFKGGTADEKQKVASSIAAGGHNELFFHMGDQISDIGVMTIAMDTLERAIRAQGKGFFMLSPNSKEGHALIAEIREGHSRIYQNGRLVLVDKELKTFAILEKVLDELLGTVHIRDGRRKITNPEDSDDLRKKLEALSINRFTELQRFYK